MLKPDTWIREQARSHGLLTPFVDHQVTQGTVSYGLSSCGYDLRLASVFKALRSGVTGPLDPKALDPALFEEVERPSYLLPPGRFVLGRSLEYIKLPREVLALCVGKSTYARCGLLVNVTPLEPGWEGFLTLSLANTGALPIRLHAGEGIAQLLFFESRGVCEVSYADRRGAYQGQDAITLPRV